MHYLRFIFGIILIVILTFILYIKNQPSQYRVSRSIYTSIPAPTLYNYLNDFENWPEWNPWILEDPEMKLSFNRDNFNQPGYLWEGKDGSGSMKTLATKAPFKIEQQMTFESFPSSNVRWNIKKNSDSLEWIMEGGMIFPMKIFTLQMGSMDAMIGPYYKKGLRAIDSILTIKLNEHRFEYKDTVILPKQFYLSRSFNSDTTALDSLIKIGSQELYEFAESKNLNITGALFTITPQSEFKTSTWSIGIPIEGYFKTDHPAIKCRYSKERMALKGIHLGSLKNIKKSWEIMTEKINLMNPKLQYYPMTIYKVDKKSNPDPLAWETELLLPYR